MKTPWKEILVALLIGMAVGWFASEKFDRPPHEWKHGQMLERFSNELKLTPEQKASVMKIMETKREQFRALHEETRPRFEEIRASSKAEIRKLLTPEQIQRFEELEKKWEERRKNWHGKDARQE
jgi:Spy/CpxP family protein refolding chaperone